MELIINSEEILKGKWIEIVKDEDYNKEIKFIYQIKGIDGDINNLTEIIISKSRNYKNWYINECLIHFASKELVEILINKLSTINNDYLIASNFHLSVIKELKKLLLLLNSIDNYQRDEATLGDLLNIYHYILEFKRINIVKIDNLFGDIENKLEENSQKDLSILPRDYLFAVLSRKLSNYKTNDGDLIIRLVNKDYSSSELRKYEKENGPLNPVYNNGNKTNYSLKIDYNNNYCALMYASDELLNDKSFLIKYITNSNINNEIFLYIKKEIRTNKKFIESCVNRGYELNDILYDLNNIKIEDGVELTIINSLNVHNINKKNSDKQNARKIDWDKKNKSSLQNGVKGEEIALKYEKIRLNNLGRSDLASKVKWISKELGDGLGFDILSYDEKTEEEIYIEIKSTKNDSFNSFEISPNEIAFASSKREKYKLYWLNDIESENPNIFICDGNYLLSNFNLTPINYKAVFSGVEEKNEVDEITNSKIK